MKQLTVNKVKNSADKLNAQNNYAPPVHRMDINGKKLPKVVEMCLRCVEFHRAKLMSLKTIYLEPIRYTQFISWAKMQMVEHQADANYNLITLYGVNIEMMGEYHIIKAKHGSDEMDWDYYEKKVKTDD